MNKFFIAAAALSVSLVSPAIAKDKATTFKHEGVTYSYTVTQISDTRRVIEGKATPGDAFRLVVAGDRVSGTANGIPVEFKVSDAKGAVPASLTTVALR